MAFPATYAPTAWVAGGTPLSQGNMNKLETQFGQVEANFQFVPKTADETVNNSTVLQNDDDLLFAVGANEVWLISFHILYFSAGGGTDIKFRLAAPVGATINRGLAYGYDVGWSPVVQGTNLGAADLVAGTANQNDPLEFWVIVANGATAGNIQLQWAQNAAVAEDTKVLENSFIIAHRLV